MLSRARPFFSTTLTSAGRRRLTRRLFSTRSARRTLPLCRLGAAGLAAGVVVGTVATVTAAENTSKQLLNDPSQAVLEAIDGFIASNSQLCRLDGYPDIKVVLRKDWERRTTNQVALISGGGSGHEPAHCGYIGEGMLTAVISGEVFASPSTDAVYAGIRAVARPGGPGVLLIVKNYTGDRINFGLAAEMAKAEGIPVEMVVVADDCALPEKKGITGGRGIAGTIFVHKIAGAAAAEGKSLAEVKILAEQAAQNTRSLGVSFTGCTLPGKPLQEKLGATEFELGMGIHGESGLERLQMPGRVDEVTSLVLDKLTEVGSNRNTLTLDKNQRVAVLVNNLGGATPLELSIVARKVLQILDDKGVKAEYVLCGPYMTALDMKGFSVSLMKLSNETTIHRLRKAVGAPAWPSDTTISAAALSKPSLVPFIRYDLPVASNPRRNPLSSTGKQVENAIRAAAIALQAAEPQLTAWDSKVGDGDCGFTFEVGSKKVLADLDSYPVNDVSQTIGCLAKSVSQSMGGTSGVLYRILFTSVHASLQKSSANGEVNALELAKAIQGGIDAVSKYGGAKEGYRTMLDALYPASREFQKALNGGSSPLDAWLQAVDAAEKAAELTKEMEALAGRSNYVPRNLLLNTPDPGAKAAAIWMRAVADSLVAKRTSPPL